MTSERTILITGVTGNQGGVVAQALQGAGFSLRGLTRKPDSERAAALSREAGVKHYVYTSVGPAHKRTGVPHFDTSDIENVSGLFEGFDHSAGAIREGREGSKSTAASNAKPAFAVIA